MDDGTTLLFDLPGFRVVDREWDDGGRLMVVMGADEQRACSTYGVAAAEPYDVRESLAEMPCGPPITACQTVSAGGR